MKRALITGITGQDGSYLAELLIEKGYQVWGIVRRSSSLNTSRIDHLYRDPHEEGASLRLVYGDLTDGSSLARILREVQPDEIYNLAAQSHVRLSFDLPEYSVDVAGLGTIRLLEAIRQEGIPSRFYQASSSELFGNAPAPQSEATPFQPRSPYAVGKLAGYWATVNYREAYGLFACNGILFNHESPRRGETFVTRKIARAAASIYLKKSDRLYLGNLDARRDWGFAGDYVRAMWLMLQQDNPEDYVVATGQSYSVRDFLDEAFECLGLDWRKYVEIDPRYFRPTEVDHLQGDATKARERLGWQPEVSFPDLVRMMVYHELSEVYGSTLPKIIPQLEDSN